MENPVGDKAGSMRMATGMEMFHNYCPLITRSFSLNSLNNRQKFNKNVFWVKFEASGQVRSGMGAYAGAARRRVHLVTVLLRPPSGHRSGRRQSHYASILQIGLHLTQPRSGWAPPRHGPGPRISRKKQFNWRDPPQGVAPHAHRGVVGAPELCR